MSSDSDLETVNFSDVEADIIGDNGFENGDGNPGQDDTKEPQSPPLPPPVNSGSLSMAARMAATRETNLKRGKKAAQEEGEKENMKIEEEKRRKTLEAKVKPASKSRKKATRKSVAPTTPIFIDESGDDADIDQQDLKRSEILNTQSTISQSPVRKGKKKTAKVNDQGEGLATQKQTSVVKKGGRKAFVKIKKTKKTPVITIEEPGEEAPRTEILVEGGGAEVDVRELTKEEQDVIRKNEESAKRKKTREERKKKEAEAAEMRRKEEQFKLRRILEQERMELEENPQANDIETDDDDQLIANSRVSKEKPEATSISADKEQSQIISDQTSPLATTSTKKKRLRSSKVEIPAEDAAKKRKIDLGSSAASKKKAASASAPRNDVRTPSRSAGNTNDVHPLSESPQNPNPMAAGAGDIVEAIVSKTSVEAPAPASIATRKDFQAPKPVKRKSTGRAVAQRNAATAVQPQSEPRAKRSSAKSDPVQKPKRRIPDSATENMQSAAADLLKEGSLSSKDDEKARAALAALFGSGQDRLVSVPLVPQVTSIRSSDHCIPNQSGQNNGNGVPPHAGSHPNAIASLPSLADENEKDVIESLLREMECSSLEHAIIQEKTTKEIIDKLSQMSEMTSENCVMALRRGELSSDMKLYLRRRDLAVSIQNAAVVLRNEQREALNRFAQKSSAALHRLQKSGCVLLSDIVRGGNSDGMVGSDSMHHGSGIKNIEGNKDLTLPIIVGGRGSSGPQLMTGITVPQVSRGVAKEQSLNQVAGHGIANTDVVVNGVTPETNSASPTFSAGQTAPAVKQPKSRKKLSAAAKAVETPIIAETNRASQGSLAEQEAPAVKQPKLRRKSTGRKAVATSKVDIEVPERLRSCPVLTSIPDVKLFVGTKYSALNLECFRSKAILMMCELPGGMTIDELYLLLPFSRKMIEGKLNELMASGYMNEWVPEGEISAKRHVQNKSFGTVANVMSSK